MILPPDDSDNYVLADPKTLPAEIRNYLMPSPKIQSRAPEIRQLAKMLGTGQGEERLAKGQGFLRLGLRERNVPGRAVEGRLGRIARPHGPLRGASGIVHCVVPGGRYSRPHRLGAQPLLFRVLSAGRQRAKGTGFRASRPARPRFGGITEFLPILQKGDNFRPPKPGMDRQRYMAEFLTGMPSPDSGKPQVEFVREEVAE